MDAGELLPPGVGVVEVRSGTGSILPKSFGKKGAPEPGSSGFCVPSGVIIAWSQSTSGW